MKEILNEKQLEYHIKRCDIEGIFDAKIKEHCRLFVFNKGELICENGISMSHLFFLVEGESKVFITLDNGKAYLLRIEKAICIYGDVELLAYNQYEANVEALNTCVCLGIALDIVTANYMNHAPFLRYICKNLGEKLGTMSHISTTNILLPLKNKLASYLLAYKEAGSNSIRLRTSFVDISEQLGTTYRHLNRTMHELCTLGMIKKDGKLIEIIALEQLEKLAGDTYRY